MTIAHNVTAKLFVAFVVISMMLTAVAPAQAQTTAELEAQIAALMATINELQSKVGQTGGSMASSVCPYAWTRSLSSGSTGDDVMKLQKFLNSSDDTRVSVSGAGSVGMETSYFGPATAAAVSKFQVKYREDILSPSGLVNPTGYFGPASMAKANMLCASAPVDGGDDSDDEGSDDEEDEELQGEGELSTFEADDASDTDIQEGSEDEVIAELTLEANDGDIEIDRMTFELDGTGNTESDPWDVFDDITLWVDGEEIASFSADDEDNYLNEDEGEFRFSGLNLVLREDEEVEIQVAASVTGNVDGAGTAADWTITATEVRYFDADGVASDDDTTDELPTASAGFSVVEEGDGEELKFSLSSGNPDATDIVVDEDDTTDGVTVLEYTIEAEGGDIELNTLFVNVVTATTTDFLASVAVDDIVLEIDGQTFKDKVSATVASQASTTYEFDIDGDVVIDEDEEVTVKVIVDLKSQGTYPNGATIKAQVTSVAAKATDAEGAKDLVAGDISGQAIGKNHTLVASGIVVPVDGFEGSTDTQGTNDTTGIFTLEFEVTAVEDTFYIVGKANSGAATTTGVMYTLDGVATTSSATLSSSADEDTDDVFTVREGETETFTLKVTVPYSPTGSSRVTLTGVNFSANTDGSNDANDMYVPTPAQDFRTSYQNINATI